jgi:HAE1 family hydrophobic/amphiphilic exporter-1
MNLTELSIKRPTLIVVIFTILTLFGIIAFKKLGYELIPKIDVGGIVVTTIYPGASPSDVESMVTQKIEDALAQLNGIDYMSSTSSDGYSQVQVQLKIGVNSDIALQDAMRYVNQVINDLPAGCQSPIYIKQSVDMLPIIKMGVTSNLEPTAFCSLADNTIKNSFNQVKGISSVNIIGGNQREIQVNLFQDKLAAYKLTAADVANAVITSNQDFPAGSVQSDETKINIKLEGKYTNIDELRNVVVGMTEDKSPVLLRDVAQIKDTYVDSKFFCRINNIPVIGIEILKQSDANAVSVIHEIKNKMEQLKNLYKEDDLLFIITYDSSEFTLEAVNSVFEDLILAILLVATIMFFFLHSVKNSFAIIVSIPCSLISAFTAMMLLHYTLNLMTLLGLSLVIGILVDDSIVVLENIFRHIEMGKKPKQAAIDGCNEIGLSASAITLVIVVVFLPMAFLRGKVGDIFRPFALVVSVTTMLSLFTAFTVTAILVAILGKEVILDSRKFSHKPLVAFEAFNNWLRNSMTSLLEWSLNHKLIVLTTVLILFLSSFLLISGGFIGFSMFGNASTSQGEFEIEFSRDISLDENNTITRKIERVIDNEPAVTKVYTVVGKSIGFDVQGTTYKTDILIEIDKNRKGRGVSDALFMARLRNKIQASVPGIMVRGVTIPLTGNTSDAPLVATLSNPNRDSAMHYASLVLSEIKNVKGLVDLRLSSSEGATQYSVYLDRYKMASLGISLKTAGQTLGLAFYGNTDTKLRTGEDEYQINIRYDKFNRSSRDDIVNLLVRSSGGDLVKLGTFASVNQEPSASRLERKNRNPSVKIKGNVIGASLGEMGSVITNAFRSLHPSPETVLSFEGDLGDQGNAFTGLFLSFCLSIVLVYLLMVALYNSYSSPLVVLFSIPLSLIGSLLALALAGRELSIFAILGIIMLIGLVAKNAILVVDFVNHLKSEGKDLKTSLIEATRLRFRPIFMTTIAMIIGMLPIALSRSTGSEWKQALGWVLIGGLLSSMFLTLIIVPIIYYLMDRIITKFSGSHEKKAK